MRYNSLTHHGILGMRWGKRNGPPYPLDESDKSAAEKKQKSMSEVERKWAQGREEDTDRTKDYNPRAVTTTKHKRAKMVKEMSDEELNDRIKRLQKETQYLQLESNLDNLDPLSGKTAASKVLSAIGNKVLIPALSAGAGSYLAFLLTKTSVGDETITFVKKAIEKGVLGKK